MVAEEIEDRFAGPLADGLEFDADPGPGFIEAGYPAEDEVRFGARDVEDERQNLSHGARNARLEKQAVLPDIQEPGLPLDPDFNPDRFVAGEGDAHGRAFLPRPSGEKPVDFGKDSGGLELL